MILIFLPLPHDVCVLFVQMHAYALTCYISACSFCYLLCVIAAQTIALTWKVRQCQ